MRSHYDDFAVGETNKLNSSSQNNNFINNNNNNHHHHHNHINNSGVSGSNSSSSYNNNNNGAIPYHARENSLPFSYGQITKTSTPLRPTTNTSLSLSSSTSTQSASTLARNYNKNAHELDFDFDFDFGLNSAGRKNFTGGVSGIGSGSGSGSGAYDYDGYGKNALIGNYASTIDRTNQNKSKRHNYHQRLYDDNDNHNDLNASEKYLNDIVLCTQQTVKYNNNNSGYSGGNNIYSNSNNNNLNNNGNNSETDASMIKAQPRLTSPLLVRKTLGNGCSATTTTNSRSPTRYTSNSNSNNNGNTNTNTISNTYHYSYGNSNSNSNSQSNKNANFIGDNNFDKFGLNGNINNNDINDINYGHKTIYGGGDVGDTLTKTPARHDFDELLRERREKVFSEYRSTTHDLSGSSNNDNNTSTLTPKASPVPPPRRFANGVVQLPSTLPPTLGRSSGSSSLYPPQIPNRSQSQSSRYNYDIEFNLNLNERYGGGTYGTTTQAEDEVDNVSIMRRRTNTIDSAPQRPPQAYQQKQKEQLYQTRDIPLASSSSTSSSYVERNYHTISSSSALTHANNRETLSPTSMLDIYATPYDERINKRTTNAMQPLEATSPASPITATTTTTLQRLQRSTEFATYGNNNNGNMFGHDHTNLGQTMTDRESSPIYATTTKKVTSTTGNYNSNSNNNTTTNIYRNTAATTPTTLPHASMISKSTTTLTSQADYPSPNSQQRPETPAFPVTPRTPFNTNSTSRITTAIGSTTTTTANGSYNPPHQPSTLNGNTNVEHYTTETIYGSNYRPRLNSSLSLANSEPQEVAAHLVKFAKDSSKFWYKPNLSREEAISLLINANPGTFVVRDSTTFKNAYGLVLRVAQPPPTAATGKPDELVRHFLIEPTTRGVRLKGCANEPVFTSLSALVYEHSINQLALPCLLNIPERDLVPPLVEPTPAQKQLMTQGAACNVLWLFSCDTESLTGEEAIRKAIRQMYALPSPPIPTEVHFKVTQQGITLTDNTRKKFFRKHYAADIISYCAIDPDHRLWSMQEHANDNTTVVGSLKKTIFAFVARRSPSSKDNQCHIFCDLAINQPASAIVSFVNKTLPTEKQKNYVL